MKLILILLRTSRRGALLTILFGLLSGASSTALLALINRALHPDAVPSSLALTFAGVAVLALLTRIASQMMLGRLQQNILLDLRLRLSKHIISTSLRRLEEAGAHRLVTSIGQDIVFITTGVMMLPEVFISLAIVLGCLSYMAWVSLPMFLALVGFIVFGQLTYSIPARVGQRLQKQAREENNSLMRRFLALIQGAKELRLNRARRLAFFETEVEPLAHRVHQLNVRADDRFAVASSWGMFIYTFVIGLLLFVVPRLSPVSGPALVSYVLVVLYLQQPLNGITAAMPPLGRAAVSIASLEELGLKLTPESRVEKTLAAVTASGPRSLERIELVDVTHTYRREKDDEKFTLGPINLSLHRGEVLFLVGGNGSGKTTLAKLLTGLYAPEAGELRVDGKPVKPEELDEYRQYFSSVFFDFHLFERLLGLTAPDLTERTQGYLKQLHLEEKVKIQDGTLSTLELSQGQRKRLALLTAYLEDRPVYIFDEWAADQDPMFKEVFYKEIVPDLKRRGKAVLVISHDDRYFQLADRIIHLESGQIVADTRPAAGQRVGT